MINNQLAFNEHEVIHELKHYLPAQAPLKDFVHHNTLHAFQNLKFNKGIRRASEIFGYKVSLSIEEYRSLYKGGKINPKIIANVIKDRKGVDEVEKWTEKVLSGTYVNTAFPRIGTLRATWKSQYRVDLDSLVHPILFKMLCSFLDQGIAIWSFPSSKGFLDSIREIEKNSFASIFKTKRAREILLKGNSGIVELLGILVGDMSLYKHYLFDQQFAHQGWSGLVSTVEDQPHTLLDPKKITLKELITFELLLEIDSLDFQFGTKWPPLSKRLKGVTNDLFAEIHESEMNDVLDIWQDAFEWNYYDQVLEGIILNKPEQKKIGDKSFQAMFCIDDRECSFRRYIENFDQDCETFSTPGFFSIEFFFQPEHGKFYTKLCPAPVTPKYLIKEVGSTFKRNKAVHFNKRTNSIFSGWLITSTVGFWSAIKLFMNIFRPTMSPATASSFRHMDKLSQLSILNTKGSDLENELQIGFTIEEMALRVGNLLMSIGLIKDFAALVYVIGHGSSSVNNPHYAAYDCGACCGRPGSVNARVFCYMANNPEVRKLLEAREIFIPEGTQFIGGLHDTSRDEILFFDEKSLSPGNNLKHTVNEKTFSKALDYNAKERSRRFISINSKLSPEKIHEKVKIRSISLFEPRPELNHATNALCIIGSRDLTKGLFLDRRAFMNSYDYKIDPQGNYLFNIIKAAAPVCGGINLEYYFSRVDNQKLGAGTKLPHNVMGLFGVANGIEGDLRPGLPSQMIEMHDPVRLLMIIEHFEEVVLKTIQRSEETYEWFINEWVRLVVINPETKELMCFSDGKFQRYIPINTKLEMVSDLTPIFEAHHDNLPVYLIS